MKKIKKFILLIIIIFTLNIIWEFSHYPLYFDYSALAGNTHLIIASFSDVLWILLVFSFISLINKDIEWINKPKKRDYLLTITFCSIIAIFIEVLNVSFLRRWAYKEAMPVLFGVGVSPLIQLFVTALIGLWIYREGF